MTNCTNPECVDGWVVTGIEATITHYGVRTFDTKDRCEECNANGERDAAELSKLEDHYG